MNRRAAAAIPLTILGIAGLAFVFQVATSAVFGIIAIAATAAIVSGVVYHRPSSVTPWALLAGATIAAAGSAFTGVVPDGSGVDAVASVALHGVALALASFALIAFARGRAADLGLAVIDALIAVAGVGLFSLVMLIEPALATLDGPILWLVVVSATGAVAVLGSLAFALGAWESRAPAWLLTTASAIALAVGEFLVATQVVLEPAARVPSIATVAFVIGLATIALAAQMPSMVETSSAQRSTRVPAGISRNVVLTLVALIGPSLVAKEVLEGEGGRVWEALAGSVLAIALAMIRTVLVMRRMQDQASQLERMADTDPVTRMGNRRWLSNAIDDVFARGAARGAVVVVGVERFTELRDSLGSRAADGILREISSRLAASAGSDAVVGRLDSAVFGVLLPSVRSGEHAVGAARAIVAACSPPFVLEALTLEIDSAAGVVLLDEDGGSADELLHRADVALAVALGSPERVVRYSTNSRGAASLSPVLVAELPRAIGRGEIVVYFQPQLDIASGRVTGAEALVRWQHPVHGLLGPDQFVPAAERTGFVVRITRFVIDQALRRCAAWRGQGLDLVVAVNLSAHDLLDPGLVRDVGLALERHRVPASSLELEVTETSAMVDPRRAASAMAGLAALGVGLSVDDFGTGYSSLAYLRSLPVSRLKIDRTFVSELIVDPASQSIVASTIDLARRLGMEVVAEGVEDDEILAALAELRCDLAQGFGLSRPIPAHQLPAAIAMIETRLRADRPGGRRVLRTDHTVVPFRATPAS